MKIGRIVCAVGLLLVNSHEAKANDTQFDPAGTNIESQEKAKIQENASATYSFTSLEALSAPKMQMPFLGAKKSEQIITRKKMLQQRKEQYRAQMCHRSIDGGKQRNSHVHKRTLSASKCERLSAPLIHSRPRFDRSYIRYIQGESRG